MYFSCWFVVTHETKHEYEDSKVNFDKDETVLNTCNQFNPAQYNPSAFQSVESSDAEVRTISSGLSDIIY